MKRILVAALAAVFALSGGTALAGAPDKENKQNAAKMCKQLRKEMGRTAFNQLYGKNKNAKNAYGKCVSKFAKADAKQEESAAKNAAKLCKAERNDPNFAASHGGKTFEQYYGTNKNGKNAYGKCVSQKAHELKAEADEAEAEKAEKTANAAKQCRKAQKDDPDAFAKEYGTSRNAFGKCVSRTAKKQHQS